MSGQIDCNIPAAEVLDHVRDWAVAEHHPYTDVLESGNAIRIFDQIDSGHSGFIIRVLEQNDPHFPSRVMIESLLPEFTLRRLNRMYLLVAALIVSGAWFTLFRSDTSGNAGIILLLSGLFLTIWIGVRSLSHGDTRTKIADHFSDYLSTQSHVIHVRPVGHDTTHFDRFSITVISFIIAAALGLILARSFLFFFCSMVIGGFWIAGACLHYRFRKTWRSEIVGGQAVVLAPVLFALGMYLLALAVFDGKGPDDAYDSKDHNAYTYLAESFTAPVESGRDQQITPSLVLLVCLGSVLVAAAYVFVTLLVGRLLRRAAKRDRNLLRDQQDVIPVEDLPLRWPDRLTVLFFAAFAGFVYWASVAMSVDIFGFFLTGRSPIIPQLGLTIGAQLSLSFYVFDGWGALLGAIVIVSYLIVTLPGLFLLGINARRLMRFILNEVRLRLPPKQGRKNKVQGLADRMQGPDVPDSVAVRIDTGGVPRAEASVLGGRRTVVVPDELMAGLSPGARGALIAHEASHTVRHAVSLKRLELLSTLALHPSLWLQLLYDFAYAEYEADKCALEKTQSEAAVQEMIVASIAYYDRYKIRDRQDKGDSETKGWLHDKVVQNLLAYRHVISSGYFGAAYPSEYARRQRVNRLVREIDNLADEPGGE